jgi:hypothetical protein
LKWAASIYILIHIIHGHLSGSPDIKNLFG